MRAFLSFILTLLLLTLSCKDLGHIVDPPVNLDPRAYKLRVDVLESPEGGSIDIRAIWGTAYNNVYAVGVHSTPYTYMFFHFDGNGWADITENIRTPIFDYGGGDFDLRGIHGFGPSDFWVVGGWKFFYSSTEGIRKQGFVLRYDGTKFVNMTPPDMPPASQIDSRFYTIWGTSSNDIWAAGSYGWILHWNGTQWSNHRMTDTTADINSIPGKIGGKVYTFSAVSKATLGFALQEFDGASWREIWYTDFSSGWFINPRIIDDTLYAAGTNGTIIRFDPAATGSDVFKVIDTVGVEGRQWGVYGFRGLLGNSLHDAVLYGGQDAGSQYNGAAGHYNGSDVMPYPVSFVDGVVFQRGFRFDNSFFLVGNYEKGGPYNRNIIVSAAPQ